MRVSETVNIRFSHPGVSNVGVIRQEYEKYYYEILK